MDTKKMIQMGDRIYTRLTLKGEQIAEFMTDSVGGMTELLSELRYYARRHRGLGQLYVRNMTRGWSDQRPLMLYASRLSYSGISTAQGAEKAPVETVAQRAHMPFPWETH